MKTPKLARLISISHSPAKSEAALQFDNLINQVDSTELQGLVFGDVTAQSVYNSSVEAGNNYPAASGRNFCNVTVAYQHAGKDDAV